MCMLAIEGPGLFVICTSRCSLPPPEVPHPSLMGIYDATHEPVVEAGLLLSHVRAWRTSALLNEDGSELTAPRPFRASGSICRICLRDRNAGMRERDRSAATISSSFPSRTVKKGRRMLGKCFNAYLQWPLCVDLLGYVTLKIIFE